MSTGRRLTTLLSSLPTRLRAQILREHHALLEDRIAWSVLAPLGAATGTPGGLMTPRRRRPRHHDELEALWALPAHVPAARS
jgi:hypothetical protein